MKKYRATKKRSTNGRKKPIKRTSKKRLVVNKRKTKKTKNVKISKPIPHGLFNYTKDPEVTDHFHELDRVCIRQYRKRLTVR